MIHFINEDIKIFLAIIWSTGRSSSDRTALQFSFAAATQKAELRLAFLRQEVAKLMTTDKQYLRRPGTARRALRQPAELDRDSWPIKGRKDLVVRTGRGYYAPKQ